MSYANLSAEVAALFDDVSGADERLTVAAFFIRAKKIAYEREYYRHVRSKPAVRAKENAKIRERTRAKRALLGAQLPPCERCCRKVTRLGHGGKLPRYCSNKCARAVSYVRNRKKIRAARNAAYQIKRGANMRDSRLRNTHRWLDAGEDGSKYVYGAKSALRCKRCRMIRVYSNHGAMGGLSETYVFGRTVGKTLPCGSPVPACPYSPDSDRDARSNSAVLSGREVRL